ncbi:MAG TPA: hypothetical protein VG318_17740 [Actinomycetota bacterium]|nr:hypothetical protein [Actinomycetota bacterium]
MRRGLVLVALLALAALAAIGGPLANDNPDGLQRVARDEGFASAERDHALEEATGEKPSTEVFGVAGVALAFGATIAVFAAVARLRRNEDAP